MPRGTGFPAVLHKRSVYMLCLFVAVALPALAQQRGVTNDNHAAQRTAQTVLSPSAAAATAKERLGAKWTDEQRADNCSYNTSMLEEPTQLRLRAEACRRVADLSDDAQRKAFWVRLAGDWEQLATEAEKPPRFATATLNSGS